MKVQLAKCFRYALFTLLIAACSGPNKQYNVILIVVDDLGWQDLGCYGNNYYETPHIDQLAKEGFLFTNAYAAASLCSPTRAAILTGKSPARLGMTNRIAWWEQEKIEQVLEDSSLLTQYIPHEGKPLMTPQNPYWLELHEVTIAELLKENEYRTAHIGKWHLGEEGYYPENQGFDMNQGGCYLGDPPSYFDPYADQDIQGIPTLAPRDSGEYLTDREIDEALQFIEKHQDLPFFLNIWHYAVHTPIQAKQELISKYQLKDNPKNLDPTYAAMIESMDVGLGRIRKKLSQLELDKNTIIIFTSDNGGLDMPYAAENDPLRAGKGYPYEGGLRIPLVIYHPDLSDQFMIDSPVISMDLYPTIAQLAETPIPPDLDFDGISLVPLIKNLTVSRESLIWHFPHYRSNQYTVYGEVTPHSIIRQGDHKLIKYYEDTTYQLFNLAEDIGENHNLAGELPDKVIMLNELLTKQLKSVNARLPKVKNR